MVASSVQLNAGKVGLCDLTAHRSFSTTAVLRPGCLQFQPLLRTVIWCIARGTRRWMSLMSAKGVLLSVSPFRVWTNPAGVATPTRQVQPTTWFCSLVNPDYIDLKRYVLNYSLRLSFLFVGVSVYRACK